jgi:hypothetical protein
MNPTGRSENLVARQFENVNAVKHGAFSRRTMAPRANEIAEELMQAPHTVTLDRIAAEEIGSIVAMLETIDADLLARGLTDREGNVRSLAELRVRLSGRLEKWLREFGATPAARVQWVERLGRGETLGDIVRSEVAEGMRLIDAAQSRGDLRAAESGDSQ